MIRRCILLDGPALFHERRGQPVQQFGMRRTFAEQTEIFGRTGQPRAEMLLPDAVDLDAPGQRMIGARDPLRQFQASAVRRGQSWLCRRPPRWSGSGAALRHRASACRPADGRGNSRLCPLRRPLRAALLSMDAFAICTDFVYVGDGFCDCLVIKRFRLTRYGQKAVFHGQGGAQSGQFAAFGVLRFAEQLLVRGGDLLQSRIR